MANRSTWWRWPPVEAMMVSTPDPVKVTEVDHGSGGLTGPAGRQHVCPTAVSDASCRTVILIFSSTPLMWPATVIGEETVDP
jgi:hypothetical protein